MFMSRRQMLHKSVHPPSLSVRGGNGRQKSEDSDNGLTNGWILGQSTTTTTGNISGHGQKRAATKEMLSEYAQEIPPAKFPALAHPWNQAKVMNSQYSSSFPTYPQPLDEDVELDLVEEVAQSLTLNEGARPRPAPGSKRKLTSFSTDEDQIVDRVKKLRMEWDGAPDELQVQPEGGNGIGDHQSKEPEVILSDEVQSMMENIYRAPQSSGATTPEEIIMERILRKNAMALVPWRPMNSGMDQWRVAEKSSSDTSMNIDWHSDDADSSNDDSSEAESLIVENEKGIPLSILMDQD